MIWWLFTSLAVIGAILNAQRRIEGFYLWVAANIGFVVKASLSGDWPMVVLWSVYTVITINGIRVWWKKMRDDAYQKKCSNWYSPTDVNCRCVTVPVRDQETLNDTGSEIAEANRRAPDLAKGLDWHDATR